jgi:hypothetical protein
VPLESRDACSVLLISLPAALVLSRISRISDDVFANPDHMLEVSEEDNSFHTCICQILLEKERSTISDQFLQSCVVGAIV